MATVHDVAAYILGKQGAMTAMKLQKLVFYSYAWHLVWEERPLFEEPIEAWANGPVVPNLYYEYQGHFQVTAATKGNPAALDHGEVESVDIVLANYGDLTALQLSELTHSEAPWLEAREGLAPGVRSNRPITDSAIAEYYDSLTAFSD